MKTTNCFAYGTLMSEDIMEEVAGCGLAHDPGILRGYSRRAVKREVFPALIADAAGRVEGVVYHDLTAPAWERLDRFEGDIYVRTHVIIELSNGEIIPAETYVIHPASVDLLEPFEWDFAEFLRNGKTRFQEGYKGYRKL